MLQLGNSPSFIEVVYMKNYTFCIVSTRITGTVVHISQECTNFGNLIYVIRILMIIAAYTPPLPFKISK